MTDKACSICSHIIGDEVAYGDTWDGRPVCEVCAEVDSQRLSARERAIVGNEVTGQDFKVIGDDTGIPLIISFGSRGKRDATVWWPSLDPAAIEAEKRRLQALACVEWLVNRIYAMGYEHRDDFSEYLSRIGWAIRKRSAMDLQKMVLELSEARP